MSSVSGSKVKVVVIGAGMAGVTAAVKLIHNGLTDVTVLEAQDYIGGRIKAAYYENEVLDLGAQFIHGREGNPLYDIAKKLDIVTNPSSEWAEDLHNQVEQFYTSSGQKVPMSMVKDLHKVIGQVLDDGDDDDDDDDDEEKSVSDYRSQYVGITNMKELVMKTYTEFIDKQTDITPEKKDIYDAVLRWHVSYTLLDNAVDDLAELSLEFWDQYKEIPGDRFTDLNGGMSGVLKAVSQTLPNTMVKLSTPVAKVKWNFQTEGRPVAVVCENGDVIEADHVIVTISLGCLKASHQTLFEPSLPDTTQEVIHRLGFGGIGKVFLFWDEIFWSDIVKGSNPFVNFEFLWLESHTPIILSDKSKKLTKFGKPWWYGISLMESLHSHPNAMELWLTMDQVEVTEYLDDVEVMNVIMEVIRAFTKGTVDVPDPVAMIRTKWMTNPYTRGTYSHYGPDFREVDLQNMDQPLPSTADPRLLFGGEAFHPDYISTVHGAFLSGEQQADRILAVHGLETKTKVIDLIAASS